MLHTHLRSKFSLISYYESFSNYSLFFRKVHRMTPNDLDMFKVENINVCYHWGPNFCQFHYKMSCFRVMNQFCEKCTKWPKTDVDMFKVRSAHLHTTYTLKDLTFSHLALQWDIFELWANFVKIALNDLKMTFTSSRLKVLTCIQHTSQSHDLDVFNAKNTNTHATYTQEVQFWSVLLYDDLFSSFDQILWKVRRMTLKWPWHVQG